MAVAEKIHTQQYYLDIRFGTRKDSPNDPTRVYGFFNPIDELYIIQDINRFLPTFRLKMQDVEGYYSHLTPYDNRQNRIRITFNRSDSIDNASIFDFDLWRRYPSSDSVYDIEGILQIENFFRPNKVRGFSGTVKDTLTTIANEMGVDAVDISPSLDLDKKIVQPDCSNVKLLQYLRDNLIGNQDESSYFCYITYKNPGSGMRKVFVFRSLEEFYKETVKYTFSDSPAAFQDKDLTYYPILEFQAYDNYKLLEAFGCKKSDYGYFDYDTGEYKIDAVAVDDYYSLTQHFSINQDSAEDNVTASDTGRSNDFTSDFKGRNKGSFFKKVNDLSKFWITTWGLEDIYPGDIVRLQFFNKLQDMLTYQYHGFWMVERVVHTLGQNFGTKLLLTRNGINTIENTMLVGADRRKRK